MIEFIPTEPPRLTIAPAMNPWWPPITFELTEQEVKDLYWNLGCWLGHDDPVREAPTSMFNPTSNNQPKKGNHDPEDRDSTRRQQGS